jgi:hypothetical protein
VQTNIPPQSTITLPPSAAPGSARIVIGPDLPPPLDTYVFNAYGFGATKFVAAIIFYANDSVLPVDDLYQFIAVVDNPGLAGALVYGLVQNGAVREFSVGRPAGLTTITQAAGVTTQLNELYDDIVMAIRAGSTGAIALSSPNNINITGNSGVALASNGGTSTITSDGDTIGLRNGSNAAGAALGSTNSAVFSAYPGNPSVTITKRYDNTALLVIFNATFFVSVANTGPAFGVDINGTTTTTSQNPGANTINVRLQSSGVAKITGVNAGSVTVNGMWRRYGGTGLVQTVAGDDYFSLYVQEIAA